MRKLRVQDVASVSHRGKRRTHAPRALIGLKGHAEIALELPSRRRGLDAERGKVAVPDRLRRFPLDPLAQCFDEFRHLSSTVHRPAPQAGTIAGKERLFRARKKLDVLA